MNPLASRPWDLSFATIRAISPERWDTTYDLAFDDPIAYSFRPGQFNMLYLPGVGESAISVSSDPADPAHVRHTVKAVGNVTRALARLKPGDRIGVRGPFGTAWPVDDFRGCDIVLVAGGIGLAPLRPVVYHVLRNRSAFGRLTLLFGTRTSADLLYASEYDAWRATGLDVQVTVGIGSPAWTGSIGFVTTLLAAMPLDPPRTALFTCGPEVMMRFVANAAVGRGIQADNVFVSLERNMNCAIGLCGHCQIGPVFACRDGPVFPFDRVRRLMHVENF